MAGAEHVCGVKVCVVGAGLSGLTAAKTFQEQGFDVTIFERSSKLGGVWNTAYRNVRLQQNKLDFRLVDYDWPEGTPDFPGKRDVQKCLKGFASRFGLEERIEYETCVVDLAREDGKGWVVTTAEVSGEARPKVHQFAYVVVACGALGPPKKAVAERLVKQGFKGAVLHSSEYQAPTSAFSNRNVVVIGGSSSGIEVAVDLARTAAKVTMVIRDDVQWVFPRYGWLGAPMRLCGNGAMWQPLWLRNAKARALFAMRYGATLDRFGLRPQHAPFEGKIIASDEFYTYLEHGLIQLVRASSFEVGPDGRSLVFSGGREEPADIVITCTGFEPPGVKSMPFLAKFLDPEVGLNGLYRSVFHPDIPDCAFVGYAYGFVSIPIIAALQAAAAANALAGRLRLPPAKAQRAEVEGKVQGNGWGTTLWLTDNQAVREIQELAGAKGPPPPPPQRTLLSYAAPAGVLLAAAAAGTALALRRARS